MFYVADIEGKKNGLADALSRNLSIDGLMLPIQQKMWKKHSVSRTVDDIFADLMIEPLNGREIKLDPRNTVVVDVENDVNEPIDMWNNDAVGCSHSEASEDWNEQNSDDWSLEYL